MRILTFRFFSGAPLSWTVDEDCTLIAVAGYLSGVVSTDPLMTYQQFETPDHDEVQERFQVGFESVPIFDIAFPFLRGQVIYVAVQVNNVPGYISLFFEPTVPVKPTDT